MINRYFNFVNKTTSWSEFMLVLVANSARLNDWIISTNHTIRLFSNFTQNRYDYSIFPVVTSTHQIHSSSYFDHRDLGPSSLLIAWFLLSCCVRLFVTLMYRNGQTYYQTFSSPGGPIILVVQNGTRLWNSDGVTPTGAPNRGGEEYQKFAIFNQYFRNTDTEPTWKNTEENTEYRYRLQNYRYRPSSSDDMTSVNSVNS